MAACVQVFAAHPALDALEARVEQLRKLEPTLRQLKAAQFEPIPVDERARLAAAAQRHLVDDDEAAVLAEALDFADTLKAAHTGSANSAAPTAHG